MVKRFSEALSNVSGKVLWSIRFRLLKEPLKYFGQHKISGKRRKTHFVAEIVQNKETLYFLILIFAMRFLILSDIHGNRFGLDKVLSHAAGEYDKILCLGDVVGYGAHPNECCQVLRDLDAVSLSGNHDAAALGLIDISWFNPVAEAAILWTRQQLSSDNRAWLRSLPAQLDFADDDFQAVHASLREPWEEYILGADIAAPNFEVQKRPFCLFGHTHQAVVYRTAQTTQANVSWREIEGAPLTQGGLIELEDGYKYLLNPGSCGQPRDGNPLARYALFDSSTRQIEVLEADYDCRAARQAILQAGLPRVLGDRLLRGQ